MAIVDLIPVFDQLALSLPEAARQRSFAVSSRLAEQLGLVELGDGKPSQQHVWERREGESVLQFEWSWRDRSRPFSIQPDMNFLAVNLIENGAVVRHAEDQYED